MRKTEFPIVHEMIDEAYKKGREDAERDFQNSDYWNDYLADVIKKAKIEAIDEYTKKLRKRIEGNKIIAEHLAKNDKFKELALTNLDLEEIEMIAEEMEWQNIK